MYIITCGFTISHSTSQTASLILTLHNQSAERTVENYSQPPSNKYIPPPTPQDRENFSSPLKVLFPKCAILTAASRQLQPEKTAPSVRSLPSSIASLHSPRYKELSATELATESERVFKDVVSVTKEDADYLERCTTLQSQSLLWFEHRKGRITASRFGAVCHTSITSPAQSLVCSILQRSPKVESCSPRMGSEERTVGKKGVRRSRPRQPRTPPT